MAAGVSTRMGRPKPLLTWHGVTLLEYQVGALVEGGADEVVVVLGHGAEDLTAYVKGESVRYVVNADYRQGKTTSIKAGVGSIDPEAEAVLLLAVDQPRTAQIISVVVQAHREGHRLITSPRYHGRGGHPLIFAASLRGELEAITEEKQGIREVLEAHRHQVVQVELDDPMVRLDLNTPEAYEEAKQLYGA
jgi:molybdenum cofactor cytidylyltransferase